MPPPQHLFAHLHQVGHTMFTIANKLLELKSNQGNSFRTVQFDTSGESFLGEETEVS